MTIINHWVGRSTHESVAIITRMIASQVRLAVDVDPTFSNPQFYGPNDPDLNGVIQFNPDDLLADTEYYYTIEEHAAVFPGASGNYVTTPDKSSLDITGAISVRVGLTITDWSTPAQDGIAASLCAKWEGPDEESWIFRIENTGELRWFSTANGADNTIDETSSSATPFTSGYGVVRIDVVPDNGSGQYEVSFYTAPTRFGPWTQIGTTATGSATSIYSGSAELSIGGHNGGTARLFGETVHWVEVHDLDADEIVADPDFATTTSTSDFIDNAGNTWSFNGTVVVDDVLDPTFPGRFITHPNAPGAPASYTIGVSGDTGANPDFPDTTGLVLASNRVSNTPVYDVIRLLRPLQFIHLGDLHYYDLGSGNHGISGGGSVDNYRRAYDDVLVQPIVNQFFRETATLLSWDDHDYGPNNSDGTLLTKGNAAQVYRERVPSNPLPDPNGAIYQEWQIGRVQFVMLDCRFYRSPNTDPDGPDKTMLGTFQKNWLIDLLNSSLAEALVVFSSVPWLEDSGGDGWKHFPDERTEVGELFINAGWADRMVMVSADWHANAMDSGVNNEWGGFPNWVFSPLDSSPGPGSSDYDIGVNNDRTQYGLITIVDQGTDLVELRGESYRNNNLLFSHTLNVMTGPVVPPTPEPGPLLTPLSIGTSEPIIRWASYHFVTGELIAELPDLSGPIGRLLGAGTSTGLILPIPLSGPGALGSTAFQATIPGLTMAVAVINGEPAWGGRIIDRRGGTAGTLNLSCATTEAYLQRRRVQDHEFDNVDEAEIMATLLNDANGRLVPGFEHLGPLGGINLEIEAPNIGVGRTDSYLRSDRATVYDQVRERSAREGGLEWTIELIWGSEEATETGIRNLVRKVARVAPRIGLAAAQPHVFETTANSLFESRSGNEATYDYHEDYTERRAATWVEAYAPGEGEAQPSSDPAVDVDKLLAGWPIDEYHWQPSSSIESVDALNGHAEQELELRRNGARLWNISSRWNVYPQLNIDWRIGDDIAWNLIGHRHPPTNGSALGKGRCIGWELDPDAGIIVPIMLDPTSGG